MRAASPRIFILAALLVAPYLSADGIYPRFRYFVTPVPRMIREVPAEVRGQAGDVQIFFQMEVSPGQVQDFWQATIPGRDYYNYLKDTPPAFDDEGAAVVRKLIDELASQTAVTPRGQELLDHLIEWIGPVRTVYILNGIHGFPRNALYAIAGVGAPDNEPFLSLRRFGVLRRRGSIITPNSFRPAEERPRLQVFSPLVPSTDGHMTLGDTSVPFVPWALPPPPHASPEARMSESFSLDEQGLVIPWSIGSEEAHEMSFRAYEAQFRRAYRTSIHPKLLSELKTAAANLNLQRLFFTVVENYMTEEALETLIFIDGGTRNYDYYETPVDKRFAALNLRERFPGEVIEIHGLAVNPKYSHLGRVLNMNAMAVQVYAFIVDGGHDDTTFVLQADKVPVPHYLHFGFEVLADSVGPDTDQIVAMAASGRKLRERIIKLFPHIRGIYMPELPNRFNRRTASPELDQACLRKLESFGHMRPFTK